MCYTLFMIKSIRDFNYQGKTVLVRVDYNVPVKDGKITDLTRVTATLPTLQHLLDRGAALILLSHLGRPKGEMNTKYSLAPVAEALSGLLKRPVVLTKDVAGVQTATVAKALKPGELMMVENLRFDPAEEADDVEFAKRLQALAGPFGMYVQDAFATLHRAHASVHALPLLMKDRAMGFLVEKEVAALQRVLENPERPFVAVLGGAKISDKLDIIREFMQRADIVLIGGALANTFVKALGGEVGESLVESSSVEQGQAGKDFVAEANKLLEEAKAYSPTLSSSEPLSRLMLPVDLVSADKMEAGAKTQVVKWPSEKIKSNWTFLDLGPETLRVYRDILSQAKSIFWNGPLGFCEVSPFEKGTRAVAEAVAQNSNAFSVVGGGDTEAVVKQFDMYNEFDHVSTGGGASVEYVAGQKLPGLEALEGGQ